MRVMQSAEVQGMRDIGGEGSMLWSFTSKGHSTPQGDVSMVIYTVCSFLLSDNISNNYNYV